MMMGDIARLDLFIDDILAASRLSAESSHSNRSSFALDELLTQLSEVCRERHNLSEEQLILDIEPALSVVSDRSGLSMVFTNLLENAVKYSSCSGESMPPVKVVVESVEKWLSVSVVDQGIGIESKYRKKVLDRFFRVPSEEVRHRHGSGLGLYVAAEICRSLGARIEIDSPGLGRGTTVTVSLPVT